MRATAAVVAVAFVFTCQDVQAAQRVYRVQAWATEGNGEALAVNANGDVAGQLDGKETSGERPRTSGAHLRIANHNRILG